MCPDTQDEPDFSKEGDRSLIILVVEDEILVRYDISEFLRADHYTVLEAASADEARAVLGGVENIDLVFSDVNMPGTQNGAELAVWIGDHFPDVPVILTSGFRPALEAAKSAAPNILSIIDKPYDNEAVELQIRSVLSRRAKQ